MPKYIIVFIFIAVVLTVLIFGVLNRTKECQLNAPLACDSPRLGIDGFKINIANIDEELLYFLDLVVIQKGKGWCNFHQYVPPEKADLIPQNKAITYFISKDHFDGQCLMHDLVVGEEYKIEILANYSQHNKTFISMGSGKVRFENNSVLT